MMVERHSQQPMKYFPKLTICPNSMHSKHKMQREYRELNDTMLQAIYGICKHHQCDRPVRIPTAYIWFDIIIYIYII